jgi:hypothetical protein
MQFNSSLMISAEAGIIGATGRLVDSATLQPVAQKGFWRVKLAWPNRHLFFGKFLTQAEAEKWIEQHRWLTEQHQKANAASRDKSNE